MSRLFISLYFDEDVSVLIGKLIASRGFTTLTTQDAHRLGQSDAEQLAFAAAQKMAVVTHNRRDFERLADDYRVGGNIHCGIIIAVRRSPYELARRLLALLDRISADEIDNQVLYI